jgi:N-methylhydantoinase A
VVPGLAAVFSAFGAATAGVRREAVRTLFRPLPLDADEVAASFGALEMDVSAAMRGEGVAEGELVLRREVDLRFRGQTWEVAVPLETLDAGAIGRLAEAFRARYAALYGRGALAHAAGIDLVNCRVIATGVPRTAPSAPPLGPPDASVAMRGARLAWLPGATAAVGLTIYDGERLAPGMTLAGPALVERRDTSILLRGGDRARIEAFGDMLIEVGRA